MKRASAADCCVCGCEWARSLARLLACSNWNVCSLHLLFCFAFVAIVVDGFCICICVCIACIFIHKRIFTTSAQQKVKIEKQLFTCEFWFVFVLFLVFRATAAGVAFVIKNPAFLYIPNHNVQIVFSILFASFYFSFYILFSFYCCCLIFCAQYLYTLFPNKTKSKKNHNEAAGQKTSFWILSMQVS